MVRILLPAQNLGCFAIKVGSFFYADLYSRRSWGGLLPGLFVRCGNIRFRVTVHGVRKDR
jgi:hypothetical protein